MAFEADCGSSMVLEAIRVARTARPLVPGGYRRPCGERVSRAGWVVNDVWARRPHHNFRYDVSADLVERASRPKGVAEN